jgi:hypothetical protein
VGGRWVVDVGQGVCARWSSVASNHREDKRNLEGHVEEEHQLYVTSDDLNVACRCSVAEWEFNLEGKKRIAGCDARRAAVGKDGGRCSIAAERSCASYEGAIYGCTSAIPQ